MIATKTFIDSHPELLFTRADKGNSTVIMNVSDYKEKMNELLSDINTYIKINKDPTTMMTNQTHKLLSRWKKFNYIDQSVYRMLNVTDGNVPRTYGLPKVHKEGNPLRIIISCINSPLYSLASFIKNIIDKSLKKEFSHIKNSFDFVNKINGSSINEEYETFRYCIDVYKYSGRISDKKH
ncbi:hypothetical protein ALC57_16846 [Trachymyrmex cornetzi]|uniref:Reverse transcriptase domain-containing protein n=1 Tax=Trachymyrmex cornetzi TaxID=471704 RepID=A0A151IU85_9HYME|nr:hypothetical protein ALC57_16846 [Trachymyrmex cornetzi]